jgi:sodium-dependent dicarboxylate transporter 2/3/5
MLGIAHGSTIGGLATPVGTPTNLVFRQLFPQYFPDAPVPGFLQWMMLGVPLATAYVLVGWWLMTRVVFPLPDAELLGDHDALRTLLRGLGPVRRDELVAGGLFAATALLWVTGKGLDLGAVHVPGWQSLPWLAGRVDDNVVAVAMASLLFVLPSADRPHERLLEWHHTREVPWGILLLFGGGFALATGFQSSGLSHWAAGLFLGLAGAPLPVVVLVACVALVLLSEFASNTATAQIALPILATAAVGLAVDPRLLMIPATLSASCAFMMPVGTPPTSIVYASGYVCVRDMVKLGVWFNVLGLVLVIGLFWLLAGPVFGIRWGGLPAWAAP